ncbi:YafY family transcriptional regulator [Mucilaginibacter robiniae]|uniref:YafY family transcriptional regulator n=1 Tax=Mucilaginibacter robiniae TaxID=2728022 RepID=A0A7L5E3R3_9SPHI|nr:YafY family protein [Mucilaginibacter robiniae]QJD96314.1 YafY family transcriptional regulator [Mucilaginibacter robiniae]
MNRIDRISAILIQLQSRRTVKASDIASRFNISLRTVYRDVKTLEEAGIPLIGEAGVGYSLADGYRLPPIMFTRDEVVAFLTAEKMVEKLTDAANGASYQSAMYKIKAVLRNTDKDFLATVNNHIEVLQSRSVIQNPVQVNSLQTILQAVAEKRILHLVYKAAYQDNKTERLIEPVGTFYLDNHWHLIAYCRLRSDYRDFRFDRLISLDTTEQHFETLHPPLQQHLTRLYREVDLVNIVVHVKKEVAVYLGQERFYHGFVAETILPDHVEMRFLTRSVEGFARWYLMFADQAQIIEPMDMKAKIRQMIKKIEESL